MYQASQATILTPSKASISTGTSFVLVGRCHKSAFCGGCHKKTSVPLMVGLGVALVTSHHHRNGEISEFCQSKFIRIVSSLAYVEGDNHDNVSYQCCSLSRDIQTFHCIQCSTQLVELGIPEVRECWYLLSHPITLYASGLLQRK